MIEIRPFRPTETEAVVALWDKCDLIRPWNDPRTDIERKLRVDPELFLVAVEEDLVLVGSVMAATRGIAAGSTTWRSIRAGGGRDSARG